MLCPACSRPMTPLFFSCVCDFCDVGPNPEECDQGYVVWRNRALPTEEYVFPTREHADDWRQANGLPECPIVLVRAPVPFAWRKSTGTAQGLVTADKLVMIYPDHRFPPAPHRAYLAKAP